MNPDRSSRPGVTFYQRPIPALGGAVELAGHFTGTARPYWCLSESGWAFYDASEVLDRLLWVAQSNQRILSLWQELNGDSQEYALDLAAHWAGTFEGLVQLCMRVEQDLAQGLDDLAV